MESIIGRILFGQIPEPKNSHVEYLGSGERGKMSKAPEICLYCDGEGNAFAGGGCGFCENGKPLDTQEDWDASWGVLQVRIERFFKKQFKKGNNGSL